MSAKTERFQPTPELTDLLMRSGSPNREVALAANAEFAKALELPLRQGLLSGDILDGIFEPIKLAQSATPEFPLDFLERNLILMLVVFVDPVKPDDAVRGLLLLHLIALQRCAL